MRLSGCYCLIKFASSHTAIIWWCGTNTRPVMQTSLHVSTYSCNLSGGWSSLSPHISWLRRIYVELSTEITPATPDRIVMFFGRREHLPYVRFALNPTLLSAASNNFRLESPHYCATA